MPKRPSGLSAQGSAGYKVVFVPDSKVWHKVSAATGGAGTGNYLYYSVRNHLHLVKTYLPFHSPA